MNNYQNTALMYDAAFPPDPDELDFYRKYIKRDQSILEVGCGTGNYILQLMIHSKATQFFCLDISKNMLNVLKDKHEKLIKKGYFRNNKKLTIYECAMEDFISNEKYDLILFPGESIQVIPKDKIGTIVNKYLRFLAKDGKLILTSFNPLLNVKEGCKETIALMKAVKEDFYFWIKEIKLLTKDNFKYRIVAKKYDMMGFLIEKLIDDFNISVIDEEYWNELIIKEKWNIELRRTGFNNGNMPNDFSSVIVINQID